MVAKAAGVGCVYQELNIVQELNVTDNLFINYYKKKGILLDYKAMHKRAAEIMEDLASRLIPAPNALSWVSAYSRPLRSVSPSCRMHV